MPLCPACRQPMVQVEENQVVAHTCPACRGTWISARALQRRTRIETDPHQPHIDLPPLADLADTVAQSNSIAPLECPSCKNPMTKSRFHPQIPITIDRCSPCAHLWLDAGEQSLLLRLYTELLATQPRIAARQQLALDTLQQSHHPPTLTATTYTSAPDRTAIALNIAGALLNILIDILLTPTHSRRSDWW